MIGFFFLLILIQSDSFVRFSKLKTDFPLFLEIVYYIIKEKILKEITV